MPCVNITCDQCADVLIIGNGPSGICLSYLLSGYRPYYNGRPHSNEILGKKLENLDSSVSILDQELEYLCEGLEGRSRNPVALLFDALTHPDADIGEDKPSLLEWCHEPQHAIKHVVLGKTKPGGSWQKMEGSMQTLSPSSWMELPDFPFKEWLKKHREEEQIEASMNRTAITDVCQYYSSFVKHKKLRNKFLDNHTVTSIRKIYKTSNDRCCESDPCCWNFTHQPYFWEVKGVKRVGTHDEEFCISAQTVVIATGTFDIPNKLKVAGENLSFVSHSLHKFESVINNNKSSFSPDPVLIVGSGLSAADAVLVALENQVPVVHAFRRGASDSSLVLKKMPHNMYPEYHKVHSLMKGTNKIPLYKPLQKVTVKEIREDKNVLLQLYKHSEDEMMPLKVSHAAILIGSRPDLNFLPCDLSVGITKRCPVDSIHNPLSVDPYSYQCLQEPGLFAMGPLVGDNFVRFGLGGALGITKYLNSRHKL